MRVAVTGATGMIGTAVVRALIDRGDEVVPLTRSAARARSVLGSGVEPHEWPSPEEGPPPPAALDGADGVIHLLGEPIAQRWSEQAKRKIRDSRVLGTRQLVAGIAALPPDRRPRTLVSQSAAGYYGPRGDERLDENAGPGNDFLADVTSAWEREAMAAADDVGGADGVSGVSGDPTRVDPTRGDPTRGDATRVVLTRTGVVIASRGGALARMLPPFKLGVGGPVAGGRQYVPWIHLDDVVGAILHVLDDSRATGPVNLTAPEPVTNAELSRALGHVLHRPAVLPVPGAILQLMYGEMASVVLTGQRVVPRRLIELGFEFRHPDLEAALTDVLRR
jgi:NAD dependent epimerase/dehydratase family enzyme